jgi:GNAT superfamily N-acetyltransferase
MAWRNPEKGFKMIYRFQEDCEDVNWHGVRDLLRESGMGHHDHALHRQAFRNSEAVVFVWHGERMIGFGRAISDGAYQAALYDMVVAADHRGRGLGKRILEMILKRLGPCNVILYASPGREGFYETMGFGRLKTGMGRFLQQEEKRDRGFVD